LRRELMEDHELERLNKHEEAEEEEDSEEYDENYIEMFGNHKRKDTRLGNNYQATKIPLITDI
jgi:hypothetical protein